MRMACGRMAGALVVTSLVALGCVAGNRGTATSSIAPTGEPIALPSPRTSGDLSLEEALVSRRSTREFTAERLSRAEIGQLLWAGQGVTDDQGRRTAPSAGALYPLELYAVTSDGVFHYVPADHALEIVLEGDLRQRLRTAAHDQSPVGDSPLVVVVTAVPARTEGKYGAERGVRYVQLEAGHAAQNVLLQAVALGLGGVPIGAFDDTAVADVLGLAPGEVPLYLLPIGHPG